MASGIICTDWILPRPPFRQAISEKLFTASGRQYFEQIATGTGCQLWLRSIAGVEWSPVTTSTSGFKSVRAGSAGVTQDGAEDLLPQKTRSEPPAPRLSRRPSESFGCASRWIPALLVAVVLAVGALLLLWRRRR